jgi:hypothetical protein
MTDVLYGRIILEPNAVDRVTWRIAVGIEPKRSIDGAQDINLVDSNWSYKTDHSAIVAAKRWAERLGITLIDEPQELASRFDEEGNVK